MREYSGQFKGARAIVTGGAGFIGSNLALRLAELECQVVVVDAFSPGAGGNLFNLEPAQGRLELVRADLGDIASYRQALERADYVFNLAGSTSHLDSLTRPEADLHANTSSHLALLEALRSLNTKAKVIYASTRQIFGRPSSLPVNEAHPSIPVDINGIHKLAAEQYHLVYHRIFGLPALCLRLTNTYGPRQLISHSRQSFLGWFLNRALTGNPIEIFDSGRHSRDFTHVEDVCHALLMAALEKSCVGKAWLLGGERATIREVAEKLSAISGVPVRDIPYPEGRKEIEIGDYYGDHAAFSAATHWKPEISLDAGIASTFRYFSEHKSRYLEGGALG